ncbi:amidohydrolase family protein [Microcella alkaliphila]|uniref:Amidohydrolase family protein n=1 Tax=Microcella alkaliphila TaxID=279828 RepID=A0A0U4X065_9MICO|nr:amidohydrolase family protein [Microcella alkaliphila]BAU33322.1 amidohydrolase family protein [Microcella alkaliphila]
MKIDSHHHVWDLSVREQDWMVGDALAPISRTFQMDEFEPHLEAHGIDHTILVQTVAVVDETPEFLDLAQSHPKVAGVVGWLDMESDDISAQLAAYREHPAGEFLVGIRDLAQYQSDPRWLMREPVVKNLQRLGAAGITYDILTLAHQLPAAVEAVRHAPETRFVVDHISKPRIADGEIDDWAASIRAIAEFENVTIKVSGMVTEANWHDWTTDTFRPYVDVVLDAFGPSRMMFGSDWPVCLLAGSYTDVTELAEALVSQLSADEQAEFFAGTAMRSYVMPQLTTSP